MIGVDTTFIVQLEVREMPECAKAHELLRRVALDVDEAIAIAPQVLTEFLHVVTDARRFERPLTMEQALSRARFWWNAREVRHVYPTAESTAVFLDWLGRYGLGRKRLLDNPSCRDLPYGRNSAYFHLECPRLHRIRSV